ncbi:MAG: lysophospholipase [Actinomycetota bacterium]|nr:lysophospholipase [Actinomycetota bacterium]
MKRTLTFLMVAAAVSLSAPPALAGPRAGEDASGSPGTPVTDRAPSSRSRVRAFDHFVSHVSSVPANAGEDVRLYLRERVRPGIQGWGRRRNTRAVLFIPGSATAAVPAFDLPFQDYSWMAYLARRGLDAFAVDLTGYGRSPRPRMDDPCNVGPQSQQELLIPNPLANTCAPSYPFRLGTTQSDLDEIDTAVDYIKALRGVEHVSLVGWSLGGQRAGLYAALHPEKVDRLVLYAPNYSRTNPSGPPPSLPQPGFPTAIRTRSAQVNWAGIGCADQVDPAVRDPLWASVLDNDPVGASWGPEEGVMRYPTTSQWGWNTTTSGQVRAPTLILRGALDTIIPDATVTQLYEDLGTNDKALDTVACASHFMMWENQRHTLHRLSHAWLTDRGARARAASRRRKAR